MRCSAKWFCWGWVAAALPVLLACRSTATDPAGGKPKDLVTAAEVAALWELEGAEPALAAIAVRDWSTAWDHLRELDSSPSALYLLAVSEAQLGDPAAAYDDLQRLRRTWGRALQQVVGGSVAALESWSLPSVLGTNRFCTRPPKDLSRRCPDEDLAVVEQYCLQYFPSELDCKIALGGAKDVCSGRTWFFDHVDNPMKPDNLARCTARELFSDYEPGLVPEVFLPPAAGPAQGAPSPPSS